MVFIRVISFTGACSRGYEDACSWAGRSGPQEAVATQSVEGLNRAGSLPAVERRPFDYAETFPS